MGINKAIPVHEMEDWLCGMYMKPAGKNMTVLTSYKTSEPHRHDFYYCVLVEKGQIELEVDFTKIQLTNRALFFSYPGQVHQINSAKIQSGWFVAFNPALFNQQLKDIFDQCLSEVILLSLSPQQFAGFNSYIDHLYKVYEDASHLFRQNAIQAMATAFVYQIASTYLTMEKIHLIRYPSRSVEITKRFMQLIRHKYKSMKKPCDYAAEMNITTSYLTDTVKSVTGFPATWFIQQELMREARRLLYHSDISVKEVADVLGYEDDKYFNRLFSKIVGVSPGSFKKNGDTTTRLSDK